MKKILLAVLFIFVGALSQRAMAQSTDTPTNTPTDTATDTATATATDTATATATSTPTNTGTSTATDTATNTATNTATKTATNTATQTATNTPTNTLLPTRTPTNTVTATFTKTVTPTPTKTNTPSSTPTLTSTKTNTPTITPAGFRAGPSSENTLYNGLIGAGGVPYLAGGAPPPTNTPTGTLSPTLTPTPQLHFNTAQGVMSQTPSPIPSLTPPAGHVYDLQVVCVANNSGSTAVTGGGITRGGVLVYRFDGISAPGVDVPAFIPGDPSKPWGIFGPSSNTTVYPDLEFHDRGIATPEPGSH